MTLVMMLTTITVWAADITQNTAVLINNNNKSTYHNKSIAGTVPSFSSAGNGGFFISKGAIVVDGIELNLTIPDGVRAFKVYDPAGKDGVYETMNSFDINSLTLTAPTGYRLQLTGDAKVEKAHFWVNDAASVWGTKILDVNNYTTSVSVTSSSQWSDHGVR